MRQAGFFGAYTTADLTMNPLHGWKVSGSPCTAIEALKVYARHPNGPLLLCGPVGTGKTLVLAALLRIWWKLGWWAEYWTAGRFRGLIEKSGIVALEDVHFGDVLCYDDLGAEAGAGKGFMADNVRVALGTLIDERMMGNRPMVIASNLLPPELAKLDERIADRLCSGVVIYCGGESRRTQKAGG